MTNEEHPPAPDSVDSIGAVWAGFFSAWRRLLSTLASGTRRAAVAARAVGRAWVRQWMHLVTYHRDATIPWDPEASAIRQAAAAIGARAFIFGTALAALSAAGLRDSWLAAAAVVAEQLLWASARFIIIALVSPRGAIDRQGLSTAFLAGLLPYVVGLTPALRTLALAGSAVLTYRGLQGAGLRRAEARAAVIWSFGGQAAVGVLGWVLRALIALTAL